MFIVRYFNVIGSDPKGRLGEAPRPELREHGRISGACFDAALGIIPGLKVYQSPTTSFHLFIYIEVAVHVCENIEFCWFSPTNIKYHNHCKPIVTTLSA